MADTAIFGKRFLVSGRVQGVYYRASTRDIALQLGLRGYARNLSDGRVEVVAMGGAEALTTLQQWLWRGSMASQVTEVQALDVEADSMTLTEGFVTQ